MPDRRSARIFALLTVVIAIAVAWGPRSATAFDIRLLNAHPEGCSARADGVIAPGDLAKIKRILPGGVEGAQYFTAPRLCLNSPGGDFLEGIAIAEYLRGIGVTTHVADGDSCLSACGLAFLGGTSLRFEDAVIRTVDRSIHANAVLGFHPPRLDVPSDDFTEAKVREAFDTAMQAAGAFFGKLDQLGISGKFALDIFAVPAGEILYIDTVGRTIDANIRVEGLRPLPEEMSQTQLREICERIDPEMRPEHFDRPESTRRFEAVAGMTLSPADTGARRGAWLTGYHSEGDLYWTVCEVRWFQPRAGEGGVSARVLQQAAWNGQSDAPTDAPPTEAEIESLLEQATSPFTFFLPIAIFPAATKLPDLVGDGEELPPVAAGALCGPGAKRYQVFNVNEFATLRSAPGFDAEVVAEAAKDAIVTPAAEDETAYLITSDSCRLACDHATRDGLSAADFQAADDCRRSNDVWWRVNSGDDTGWMSARFLRVR